MRFRLRIPRSSHDAFHHPWDRRVPGPGQGRVRSRIIPLHLTLAHGWRGLTAGRVPHDLSLRSIVARRRIFPRRGGFDDR